MKSAIALGLLAACSFPKPSEDYACRTTDDCDSGRTCTNGYCVIGNLAETDAANIDSGSDCASFTSRFFDACMIPAPAGDLDLTMAGAYTLDTMAGSLTPPGGSPTALPNRATANGLVISVGALHVATGATLRIVGANALILASWSSITVDGTIDASSGGTPATRGPGANPTGCTTHAAVVGVAGAGGGGGGGGGGQAAGGKGGGGGNGDEPGGNGGALVAAPLLLGGCPGARGGDGNSSPGDAGDGGGAIQLTARLGITVSGGGKVLAGGAGGKPGAPSGTGGGGGGGGAGGMVGLEAPMLTISAGGVLAANGGGGGQGAGNQGTAGTGQPGQASATRATGGTGGSGGAGGPGGAGTTLGGSGGGTDGSGGGGGGGGTGFIAIKAGTKTIDPAAVISPAATFIP